MYDLIDLLLGSASIGAGMPAEIDAAEGGRAGPNGLRPTGGPVDTYTFMAALTDEADRPLLDRASSALALIRLEEVAGIRRRLGAGCVFDLVTDITKLVARKLAPDDWYHVSEEGEIAILARGGGLDLAVARIDGLCAAFAGRRFRAADESVTLTACVGIVALEPGISADVAVRRAGAARRPVAVVASGSRVEQPTPVATAAAAGGEQSADPASSSASRLRTPVAVATISVSVLAATLAWLHQDAVAAMQITDVIGLVLAGTLLWVGVRIAVATFGSGRRGIARPPVTDASVANATGEVASTVAKPDPGHLEREPGGRGGNGGDASPPLPLVPAVTLTGSTAARARPVEAVVKVKIVEGAVLDRRVPLARRAGEVPLVTSEPTTQSVPTLAPASAEVSGQEGERLAAGKLPRRSPGASLARTTPPAPAISEHARLTLRPGQSSGVLVRSNPEKFVREYDHSARYTLAALQGMRASPVRNSM